MERVSSMSRRFAEWTIAEHIIQEELEDGDIIIKDGSFKWPMQMKVNMWNKYSTKPKKRE